MNLTPDRMMSNDCKSSDSLETQKRLAEVERLLYRGNGQPPLLSRVAAVELTTEANKLALVSLTKALELNQKEQQEADRKRLERQDKQFYTIIATICAVGGIIAPIVIPLVLTYFQ